MSKKAGLKSATMLKILLLIVMAVAVMLISDIILVNVISFDESSLLFVEGVIFILIGAIFAVGASDTPVDVMLETYHRGVPLRPEPMREGYGSNKRKPEEQKTGLVLVTIGVILIVLGFVVFLVV